MTSTPVQACDININMASDDVVHVPVTPMYIKNVHGKGRGVYAGVDIAARTLINISPVLLFPETETRSSPDTNGNESSPSSCSCACPERDILAHYTYSFGQDAQALALGMGSMFNHSRRKNNVGFVLDKVNLLIRYTTLREVAKDSELLINYGNRLWFVEEREGSNSDSDSDSDKEGGDPFSRMDLHL